MMAPPQRRSLGQRLRLGLDAQVSLPLLGVLLLIAIWAATLHAIDSGRASAQRVAADSVHELLDTYEAQVARSLAGIEQTLNVLKYAVELKGPLAALPELQRQGLLPPGVVFIVSVVDRDGLTLASNPPAPPLAVADQMYFQYHRAHDSDHTYVSEAARDSARSDWHLHFTRRLNDGRGRFAGIVIVEADPAYFTSSYERGRVGVRGMLGVAGGDGVVRAMRVGNAVTFGQHLASAPPAMLAPSGAPAERPHRSAWDGVVRYDGARQLHGIDLSVSVGLAEDEQMAAFMRERDSELWRGAIASTVLVMMLALIWHWNWQNARSRRSMRRIQETYAAASQASLDAFFLLREVRDAGGAIVDFKIIDANGRAELMTGRNKQRLRRRSLCQLFPQLRGNGIFDMLVAAGGAGGVHENEWQFDLPRAGTRWLRQQTVSVERGVVAIVRDITERKQAEQRILHLARHDSLTGLPNRALVGERLEQAISQAARQGHAVLVAFIDLDGFKIVNDGLGHNAGDRLLQVVAGRMAECVRVSDTVGRFGGYEFVLVLPQLDDAIDTTGANVLERVRAAVCRSIALAGQEVQVSCSIGVAVYPYDGADPDTLLKNADAAMYRAKDLGKNNCQFYTQEMNASLQEKLALLEGLRGAIDDRQLFLVYQPKVDLLTGRIFGAEALVRWRHPRHGVIGPDRFIPLAEESGLITMLGDWVLQAACKQNRAWQLQGLAPVCVSVNVSPRQFEDRQLVARVGHALADSGLHPAWLELEVTEGLIMRDLTQAVEKMRSLKAMGVSLSIDDFGTGYSSLAALKSFPVSTLKIDKSFVRDLASSSDDQAIASAIIGLAHQLNLRVIAEGVETEQQRQFLADHGCDDIQGYLFSRPLAPDAMRELLEAQAHGQPDWQARARQVTPPSDHATRMG
ncbi:EAL domain-containing protein [Rugamonas sp.]|uniref:bifunctional diguanylate cyclase/phosphodiesterase n=1 Tax=Rugamonas sp. TaxID=1926287 RepID=UPI0025E3CCC5|nr:EAL domain-containing protein [Rugamonas sp.]